MNNIGVEQLVKKAKIGNEEAKVTLWLDFIERIAYKAVKEKGIQKDVEDIMQECYIEFEKELKKNKRDRAFLRQIKIAIRGRVVDYMAENTIMKHSRKTTFKMGKYRKLKDAGKSNEEIMKYIGVKKDKITELGVIQKGVISLDSPIKSEDGSRTYMEKIEDTSDDFAKVEQEMDEENFLGLLSKKLKPKEFKVIRMLIDNPYMTNVALGEAIGCCDTYARRVKIKARDKAQTLFKEFYGLKKSPSTKGHK